LYTSPITRKKRLSLEDKSEQESLCFSKKQELYQESLSTPEYTSLAVELMLSLTPDKALSKAIAASLSFLILERKEDDKLI